MDDRALRATRLMLQESWCAFRMLRQFREIGGSKTPAVRLRQHRYIGANTVPVRKQVRDAIEFVRIVWEESSGTSRRKIHAEVQPGQPVRRNLAMPTMQEGITAQNFRLAPGDASSLLCLNRACGRTFPWKQQNKGKLWPEQRAYNVLR